MPLLLSLAASIAGGAAVAGTLGQYRRRRRTHQLIWALGLAFFTAAALCQVVGEIVDWSDPLYRAWYLTGVVLAAAFLGQGSVHLLAPRPVAWPLLAALAVSSVVAAVVVAAAPVSLAAAGPRGAIGGSGMPDEVRLLSPLFNVYGTVAVLGGAALGTWRFLWYGGDSRRAIGTVAIGTGALVVATGGTLSRLGVPDALYAAEAIGLGIIAIGFAVTDRPAALRATAPAALPARRRRVMRLGVALGVSVPIGAVAVLPFLPWLMGIVGDVRHVYAAAVPDTNRGAYLVTDRGVMQLYGWAVEPPTFPSDAPTLEAAGVRELVIVQRQFDAPDRYRLYDLGERTPIGWAMATVDGPRLTLRPTSPLAPGAYQLVVPTDGMYGGYTAHYFRLE